MSPPEPHRDAIAALPAWLRDGNAPVFAEPWQAQAFAITVALVESGQLDWPTWAATMGDEISHATRHGIAEDGSGYYELWLRALERLVVARGLSTSSELEHLRHAWRDAFESTPHGQPVGLPESA